MKIFKFGGGILTNPEAIRQLPEVLDYFPGDEILIVISAFGKTTNALELLIEAAFKGQSYELIFNEIKVFHTDLVQDLFPDYNHPVFAEIDEVFTVLKKELENYKGFNYDRFYDRIIGSGEILSSKIIHHFLNQLGKENIWMNAQKMIITDDTFRNAKVDWEMTNSAITSEFQRINKLENRPVFNVTQGFIGKTFSGEPSSLGREGSDFTAAIFAYCLDVREVIIWKDVPGVLNADPKYFAHAVKLDRISYAEATELAYYGAKILHPKTIKPLKDKNIILQVRSYFDPVSEGTVIMNGIEPDSKIPKIIQKFDQVLFSVSPRDLSIMSEEKISDIQEYFSRYSLQINLIQNSALSLSFCTDKNRNMDDLLQDLKELYVVRFNEGLELITIRHYNPSIISEVLKDKTVLLEQQTRATVQYIVKSSVL